MDESTTIAKLPARLPSQDYELLRREGLRHIEEMAHDLWTDYNTHDPGITILEALCYAITELGYRTGFDVKDLVVNHAGEIDDEQTLYTAKNILTINPVTINDYRKLLIDIAGVHNAWLIAEDKRVNEANQTVPVNEVPVYADFENDGLDFNTGHTALFLSGLYRVLLDLDNDDSYGDLNTGDIVLSNPAFNGFQPGEFMVVAELPAWNKADIPFAEKAADTTNNQISNITVTENGPLWLCHLTLNDGSALDFGVSVPRNPAGRKISTTDITGLLNEPGFLNEVFEWYLQKIGKAKNIVSTAVRLLHERRNCCEDFLTVDTIASENIAFCFDVDVRPATDIEKVQAEIFFAIETYLNPSVDFYSLKELLDRKVAVDEIFNGPVLQHGFIDTQQLERTQLRSVIHTSDIVNLLMDIEGVLAIRNFVMTRYDENGKAIAAQTGLTWCMPVTVMHKPVLDKERSKILLFKDQFPFLARYDEVRDTVLLLHAQHTRSKLQGLQQDIPIPQGRKRDTTSYWPVQYDFPQAYGIGQHGLPANASAERRAQQKQLKAYLMFYEQVLADFFAQLSNAYRLFSIAELKQTYYAQFLGYIKDIDPVYKLSGGIPQLKAVIENADATSAIKNGWQDLYESKQVFEDRRNRFLDHLLARFAESFNDYALMMYRINYEDRAEEKISFGEMVQSKCRLLRDYPVISSQRGKAFNYYPQKEDGSFSIDTARLWNTGNVSGLEKKICSITGIIDDTRRFLYCIRNIEIVCQERLVTENGEEKLRCFHVFKITTPGGISMHNSQDYDSKEKALQAVATVIESAGKKENYNFDATAKRLVLTKGEESLMQTPDNSIADQDTAAVAIDAFTAAFNEPCMDPVGLHLLEHILLRPRDNTFKLMQVCLHDGECPCDIDPYTFRASVVLPYWPAHFDNMSFREYFEAKIREEAPAHIMLKICWLNNDLMRGFEVRYKKWIETMAAYAEDKVLNLAAFREANDSMIDILSQLHSEYPMATLHDCIESKQDSTTVVLGKTVLGTFKNQ